MKNIIINYKFTITYLIAVIFAMVSFTFYPLLIDLGGGASFSAWALVVGFWFVLRDYSQREIGHFVLIPMSLGIIISVLLNQALALATIVSSAASDLTDYLLYTFLKLNFSKRILISSLISCPIDSFFFFAAFDYFQVIPGVSVFNWTSIFSCDLV